jgi:hypothetical protein
MFLRVLAKQTPETFSPVNLFAFLQFSATDFVGKQIMNKAGSTQNLPWATIMHGCSIIDATSVYIKTQLKQNEH